MPHYDYICDSCSHKQEIFQKITDKAFENCPQCLKSTFRRMPGRGGGLLFRGDGFYETDYNASKPPSNESEPKSSSSSDLSCCPCARSGHK
jgi:putative FmdB family regulatory protein